MGGQHTWKEKRKTRATMHKSMRYANHPCSSKCGEGEVILPCTAGERWNYSSLREIRAPVSLCVCDKWVPILQREE